jgi:hypothetical protein
MVKPLCGQGVIRNYCVTSIKRFYCLF